jgi:hypothetical protein
MKLEITYKIAEVSADEDLTNAREEDLTNARELVAATLITAGGAIMESIKADRRAALQAQQDEQRRWDRFMHYCHTGVML